jgi:hypothetical protein
MKYQIYEVRVQVLQYERRMSLIMNVSINSINLVCQKMQMSETYNTGILLYNQAMTYIKYAKGTMNLVLMF